MDPYKYFPDRRPEEEVVLLLRRHWSTTLRHFLLLVAEFFLPLVVIFAFLNFTSYVFEKNDPLTIIIVLAASTYYLYIWLFFFHHWLDYYLDVWVVTNQRILNIEQEGLFSRTISELNLEKIQDVTSEVKGKLATVLDFGDVHIQTAAEEKRFIFEEIPNPRQVVAKIIELHQSSLKKVEEQKKDVLRTPSTQAEQKQNETRTF